MSFGAFGGRADIMDLFDPRRPDALPHAGTFNNNVLTMAAGLAGLTEIYTPERAPALNARGDALRERLNALCRAARRADAVHRARLDDRRCTSRAARSARPADAANGDPKLKELFFFDMLAHGIWLARRGMMTLSPADRRCRVRPARRRRGRISEHARSVPGGLHRSVIIL